MLLNDRDIEWWFGVDRKTKCTLIKPSCPNVGNRTRAFNVWAHMHFACHWRRLTAEINFFPMKIKQVFFSRIAMITFYWTHFFFFRTIHFFIILFFFQSKNKSFFSYFKIIIRNVCVWLIWLLLPIMVTLNITSSKWGKLVIFILSFCFLSKSLRIQIRPIIKNCLKNGQVDFHSLCLIMNVCHD